VESFSSLFGKLQDGSQIWVRLHDGLKLCLVGVDDIDRRVFIAKFLPCAANARTYPIRYDEIAKLEHTE
jgi:hypothetical protein